jgi:aminoglycoside 3-N-acetyltransferase
VTIARRTVLDAPLTRVSLRESFERLGVVPGETILVHSSLRSLGWVCGGARCVVLALLDLLGDRGTLVCPAQTPENRDPSRWDDPMVSPRWWPCIRENLPAFDPATSPTTSMGLIAEQVRTWPGAARSAHPQTSFCAVGPAAADLMSGHKMSCQLGEASPLRKLEDSGARVLLLGVPFSKTTAFHLAEYRLDDPPRSVNSCAVQTVGGRKWVTYEDVALDSSDFDRLGSDFEAAATTLRSGRVGLAKSHLFAVSEASAFAEKWLRTWRPRRSDGQAR